MFIYIYRYIYIYIYIYIWVLQDMMIRRWSNQSIYIYIERERDIKKNVYMLHIYDSSNLLQGVLE